MSGDFSKEKPWKISRIVVGVPAIISQVTSQKNRQDTLVAVPACLVKHELHYNTV
jgi:hypothetical protein